MHFKTALLVSLGFIFLGLGAIGLLLPVWPTTPFVLLSAACLSSSPRIKARIVKIPFFREHIENYQKRTGLTPKIIWISLIWLWGMLFISIILLNILWIRALLFLIGFAVTIHILWMSKAKDSQRGRVE